MNLGEAICMLFEGGEVRGVDWHKDQYWYKKGKSIYWGDDKTLVTAGELHTGLYEEFEKYIELFDYAEALRLMNEGKEIGHYEEADFITHKKLGTSVNRFVRGKNVNSNVVCHSPFKKQWRVLED